MTDEYKKANMKFVTMDNFVGNKLKIPGVRGPVMLMIYGDFCPHCHTAAPTFIKNVKSSKFNLACIEIDNIDSSQSVILKNATKGIFDGYVPKIAMFNGDGKCTGEYKHKVNGGCMKYEYHKMTGEGDAGLC